MKESYKEGDAHHFDPESCLDDPRGHREALTGENAGGLLSSEITSSRMPTWLTAGEGNVKGGDKTRDAFGFGGVVEPGMCGHSLRGNRDTSTRSGSKPDNVGKDNIRNPIEYAVEESDDAIVPEKPANKGTAVPAEPAEESASAKRNSKQNATNRIQGRAIVSNGLQRVRQRIFNARLKAGAVCGNSARTDLYGGHPVTDVPTVTPFSCLYSFEFPTCGMHSPVSHAGNCF